MLTPVPCEGVFRRKNAAPFYAHLQISKTEDDKGLPCFRVAVCDITESKMLENLIKQECQLAKQASQTRSVPKRKKGADQP